MSRNRDTVILYRNYYHDDTQHFPWIWDLWGKYAYDDVLEREQLIHPQLHIHKAAIADIFEQDGQEYKYIKLLLQQTKQ